MRNKIEIKLPCPKRVGFISLNKSKLVGFSFDNLSAFNFRENIGVKDGKELKKWVEKVGNSVMFVEVCWGAIQSYSMHTLTGIDITKKEMVTAFSLLPKTELQKVIDAWHFSETYGYKEVPTTTKKKVVTKKK